MQKKVDNQKTVGGESVGEDINSAKIPKFTVKLTAAKTAILIGLLIIIGVGVYGYVSHKHNLEKINQPKVAALIKTNDCSNKALQSVSTEKPSAKQADASIPLLSYRASCLNQLGRYQEAIGVYNQLKTYYMAKHDAQDQAMALMIDDEIAANKYNISHPVSPAATQPASSDPTLVKSPYTPGATP